LRDEMRNEAKPHEHAHPQAGSVSATRKRSLIAAGIILAILSCLLLGIWLAPRSRPSPRLEVRFTPFRHGHMGDLYSEHFTVVIVSNAGPRQVNLLSPSSEYEENSVILKNYADTWGGTNPYTSLPANCVMPLPIHVPINSPRYRISFSSESRSGIMQRLLTSIERISVKHKGIPLLARLRFWAATNGIQTFTYEGTWQTNAQPIRAGP